MSEKIRILFLITDLGKGGAERFLIDHSKFLLSTGKFDIIIGSLGPSNEYPNDTKDLPIVFLDYEPFSFWKMKFVNQKYKYLLDTFKPHIIHTNRFLAEFLSSYYLDKRIRYVCHGHDNMVQLDNFNIKTLFNIELLQNYFEKWLLILRKYLRVKTYFIANSQHTFDYYNSRLPFFCKKSVSKIELGFNFSRFFYDKEREISYERPLKLINVGSFQKKKNQIFIIQIAKLLEKYIPNFQIGLIGQGEMLPVVEKAIESEGLTNKVFCRGVVDKVEKYYQDADIYIHTATYEPFGLVFLEAMASGLPVITLDGKGNRAVIVQGKTGFLIEEQDAEKFAQKIVWLYHNQQQYKSMSVFCREFSRKYDYNIKGQEFIRFYNSILSDQ